MSTVLNPITEFSPPLILNPIRVELKEQVKEDIYNQLEGYINSLATPFWVFCLLNNKFVKIRTNEIIVIEYPDFLDIDDTNFTFPDNISKNQKKIIDFMKKIFPNESDFEIVSYIALLKEEYPKIFDKILCYKKKSCDCKKNNNSIFNNLLPFNKNKQCETCNGSNNSLPHEIKKIIKKNLQKNLQTIIIGQSGVNAINQANFSVSSGAFSRNDYIQVNIPDYIKNFYQLVKFLEFLQEKQILLNTELIKNKTSLLPRYENITDDLRRLVQNRRIFRQNDYAKYLDKNGLTGTLNFDPQNNTDN